LVEFPQPMVQPHVGQTGCMSGNALSVYAPGCDYQLQNVYGQYPTSKQHACWLNVGRYKISTLLILAIEHLTVHQIMNLSVYI
jgi:hypothetical protein